MYIAKIKISIVKHSVNEDDDDRFNQGTVHM